MATTFTKVSQRIPPIDYNCERCKEKFSSKRKDGSHRFCSRKCYTSWKHEGGWLELVCEGCGAEFGAWKSRSEGERKYCSKKCYWNRLHGNKRVREAMGRRWSWAHEECVECGTTEKPHYAKGRCVNCDSRMRARVSRGSWQKGCQICEEHRAIDTCHIVPRQIIGERWDAWMVLYLCPTHHKLYDTGRLNKMEWRKIESRVRIALERFRSEGIAVKEVRHA